MPSPAEIDLLRRLSRIERKLDGILFAIVLQGETMSAGIDRLKASVTANTTTGTSVLALIQGLAEQIRATAGDEEAANALADELDAETAAFNAAVTANTKTP